MSSWRFIIGASAYVALLGALAASMFGAAKLFVRQWRWFQEPPIGVARLRIIAARAAAACAPLGVAIALSWAGIAVNGVPKSTTKVEVGPGAGREAGLLDNDRILSVDGEPVATFEQLRAVLQRKQGALLLVVERDRQRLELSATPRGGRLGIAQAKETERLPPGAAFVRAVKLPFQAIAANARSFLNIFAGRDRPELAGPVSVVRETSNAESEGSLLMFLALLAAHFSAFLAGVPVFDTLSSWAFRSMHPQGVGSPLRGYRLERLRLTLLLATSGYLTSILAVVLMSVGVPGAMLLVVWSMPSVAAVYPLLWVISSELKKGSGMLLAVCLSLLMPCFAPVLVIQLLGDLRRALRNEGFGGGWFRADPA